MQKPEGQYPNEDNLGKECLYWGLGGVATGCCFPKLELEGRQTCGGIIDDVCLYVKDGRPPGETSRMLLSGIKLSPPDSSLLPPGEIV
jgi:hypothetical protein